MMKWVLGFFILFRSSCVVPHNKLYTKFTTTENLIRHVVDKQSTLLVGEGDFSFARVVANWKCCERLVASTWDGQMELNSVFESAGENVEAVKNNYGCVHYNIDATRLPFGPNSFSRIIWNYPHVKGKQNIKYNRELLAKFLLSTRNCLKPGGSVHITLCPGQSGTGVQSQPDWLFSWKLPHQCAEAGLLMTKIEPFNATDINGYLPTGRRGKSKSFKTVESLTKSHLYTFKVPDNPHHEGSVCSVESPLYAHEMHLLSDSIVEDLEAFEQSAKNAILSIFEKSNLPPSLRTALWSVHMVDLYICSQSKKFSHSLQITYCSKTAAVGRDSANLLRGVAEEQLPKVLGMKLRWDFFNSSVSKPHPWYIAEALSLQKPVDEATFEAIRSRVLASMQTRSHEGLNAIRDWDEKSPRPSDLVECHEQVQHCARGNGNENGGDCVGDGDGIDQPQGAAGEDTQQEQLQNPHSSSSRTAGDGVSSSADANQDKKTKIRAVARPLWKRKIGVLYWEAGPSEQSDTAQGDADRGVEVEVE